jgi:flagellar hook-basal body complex protein FliE
MQIDRNISGITPLKPGIEPLGASGTDKAAEGPSFMDLLSDQMKEVEQLSSQADALQQGLLTGEVTDIQQVVTAVQKADMAMTFTLQLRNKVLEAYQEISRMQI